MANILEYKEYLINSMESALYRAIHESDSHQSQIHMTAYLAFRDALDTLKMMVK